MATASGVARTTIYRRHHDREQLLEAALMTVTERGAPDIDLPVSEKLHWVVARAEEVLADGVGLGGVSAVLTGREPELGRALRRALAIGSYLARALRDGTPSAQWREQTVELLRSVSGGAPG